MENQLADTGLKGEMHTAYGRESSPMARVDDVETPPVEMQRVQMRPIDALRIPVGTNLADVERWMIFATLQKCGGNKTRAAALLGVSLKTLYNRLNAYRTQGLTMDYESPGDYDADTHDEGREPGGDLGAHRDEERGDDGTKRTHTEAQ